MAPDKTNSLVRSNKMMLKELRKTKKRWRWGNRKSRILWVLLSHKSQNEWTEMGKREGEGENEG